MIKKIKQKLIKSTVLRDFLYKSPSWVANIRKIHSIDLEISSACNLRCTFCPVGNKKVKPGLMSLKNHNKIIDLLPKSVKLLRYSYRGDATINPHMTEMIRYAHDKGFKTDCSTNGMILDKHVKGLADSRLDRLIIAIDGATQSIQSKYRIGSDLEKIKKNIKMLVAEKKRSKGKYPKTIAIQTVVTSYNEHQIKMFQKMAKNLGVDKIKFKTLAVALGSDYEKSKEEQETFLPKNKNYWRKGQENLICPGIWETVILYNGDVSICCGDFLGKYVMGNILKEKNFKKVMYNKKYDAIRKSILKKSLPICTNCPITGEYWIDDIGMKFSQR